MSPKSRDHPDTAGYPLVDSFCFNTGGNRPNHDLQLIRTPRHNTCEASRLLLDISLTSTTVISKVPYVPAVFSNGKGAPACVHVCPPTGSLCGFLYQAQKRQVAACGVCQHPGNDALVHEAENPHSWRHTSGAHQRGADGLVLRRFGHAGLIGKLRDCFKTLSAMPAILRLSSGGLAYMVQLSEECRALVTEVLYLCPPRLRAH